MKPGEILITSWAIVLSAAGCSGADSGTPDGLGGSGGTFLDGGSEGCPEASGGPPMVMVQGGYCIDTTEVTRAQYQSWLSTGPSLADQPSRCAANGGFEPDAECMAYPETCKGPACDNHPQVCVDWCDAYAFCKAVGKRLCGRIGGGSNDFHDNKDATKSQWVHACSAGGTLVYPYGNEYGPTTCNGNEAGIGTTEPVAARVGCTNSLEGYAGIFDMSGNAWEWEDSCDDRDGGPAVCRAQGGGFSVHSENLTCKSGTGEMGVAFVSEKIGFRCCGP